MRSELDMTFDDEDDEENEEEEPRYPGRRVTNLGKNVEEWSDRTGEGSSTYNLCRYHARWLDSDPHCFDNELNPYHIDEPVGEDGWGGDVEHPNFDDDEYRCVLKDCRCLLTGW
jgi:hypothetical protein